MTEAPPLLNVAVISHNYGRFLRECVDSILGQTWQDFELLLVDDGSTDETRAVMEGYAAADARVRVQANARAVGFGEALPAAMVACRGRYLVVIGADDYVLAADAFERQVKVMEADPRVSVCFTGHWKRGAGVDDQRRLSRRDETWEGAEFLRRLLLRPNFSVSQTGAMIRASAYRETGGYDRSLRHYADFRMWVALCRTGKAAYVDGMLYGYRMHGQQHSGGLTVLKVAVPSMRWAAGVAREMGLGISNRQVLRARIGDPALADAFANRRRSALGKAAGVLRAEPVAALTSVPWWVAVVRAVLGEQGWAALGRVAGRGALRRRSA